MISDQDFVELVIHQSKIRCSNCKHWNTSEDAGDIHRPKEGYGICEKIRDSTPGAQAYVAFGYDLATTPDFHCSLWEEKDGA